MVERVCFKQSFWVALTLLNIKAKNQGPFLQSVTEINKRFSEAQSRTILRIASGLVLEESSSFIPELYTKAS